MKLVFKILFLILSWNTSLVYATTAFNKVALPSHAVSFPKTENQKLESAVKIEIQNFARSGITINSTSKNVALWESSVLENRLREVNVRVVNTAGKVLDDIYNAQKAIVNQWKNTIATATNIRKGNFGEIASDAFLAEKNFQPLHTRLQSIDAPTRQGIDGVFKKGNDYFIVESKYSGTATLSTLTDGTKQMSDAWIRGNRRLIDAVGEAKAQDIIDAGYKRLLAEIAPDGTIVYKELDANASLLGVFNP